MPVCPCGSTTVHIIYTTPTTLTLVDGKPVTVDYSGGADPAHLTALCEGCQAVLDIDQVMSGGMGEETRVVLTGAKMVAQAWLGKLPQVTLRARVLSEEPAEPSSQAAAHDDSSL